MKCSSCGVRASDDGYAYCAVCGSPLKADGPATPDPLKETNAPDARVISRNKALSWLGVGAGIAAVVILIVVMIASQAPSEQDYVRTVQETMIPEDSLYGSWDQIIGKYMTDVRWSAKKTDDGAYVNVDGKLEETDIPIWIQFSVRPMEDDSDRVWIVLEQMQEDGIPLTEEEMWTELGILIDAYASGADSLFEYVSFYS